MDPAFSPGYTRFRSWDINCSLHDARTVFAPLTSIFCLVVALVVTSDSKISEGVEDFEGLEEDINENLHERYDIT